MDFQINSPSTPNYNCIAWAADDNSRWWQPDPMGDYYWPENLPRESTLESYTEAFKILGYEICDDESLELGFQKIAIYFKDDIRSIHAARQLNNGRWTSKLGSEIDIEHNFIRQWSTLKDSSSERTINLSGYGQLRIILRKPLNLSGN